ncbi:MAG: tetratricopeptide repeat protein [Candidatus Aminicenantes bacterium]|nr:tetratricopeptide repeat protein [Candidatus Aminicenantes bacterium]
MKKSRVCVLLMVFFLNNLFLLSEEPMEQSDSPVLKQIRQTMDRWVKFWNSYDLDELNHLFVTDPKLSYFSSEKAGLIQGIDQVRKHHQDFGFLPGGKKSPNQLWIQNLSINSEKDTATATATWFFKKPKETLQWGPMTAVLIPKEDTWKIIHMHFANHPSDTIFEKDQRLFNIPPEVQAISLLGEYLIPEDPPERFHQKYRLHQKRYDEDPLDADNIIWYGRWSAYLGNYQKAIRIYSQGISLFPDDARFYRHRGHRMISIRKFDQAIADFQKAVQLIEGEKDQIEPDGMPNAQNIPVSSLHTNIYYHLGLAFYLKGDYGKAVEVYRKGLKASTNDDMRIAMIHWLYMSLRLIENNEEAQEVLNPIHPEMTIIENQAYYRLCLFYKGILKEKDLYEDQDSQVMSDAVAYGLANWHFYQGDKKKAKELFRALIKDGNWASFGVIAAESQYFLNFF